MKLQPQRKIDSANAKTRNPRNYVHENIIRAENIKKENHFQVRNRNENYQLNPYNCRLVFDLSLPFLWEAHSSQPLDHQTKRAEPRSDSAEEERRHLPWMLHRWPGARVCLCRERNQEPQKPFFDSSAAQQPPKDSQPRDRMVQPTLRTFYSLRTYTSLEEPTAWPAIRSPNGTVASVSITKSTLSATSSRQGKLIGGFWERDSAII